jgi:isopentenyl-diphosphate delta-isomerase
MTQNDQVVSFDDEKLIVVDENDKVLGFKTKTECHAGKGILHRAFSIFIFNDENQLLIQKRSDSKQLWPLYWSNSCCSHPRKGETVEEASHRRLKEELGIETQLKFLFKFQYAAPFGDIGSEKEMCSVLVGRSNNSIAPNRNEIAEWKYMGWEELDNDIGENPADYTPWFKMEWERIRTDHLEEI